LGAAVVVTFEDKVRAQKRNNRIFLLSRHNKGLIASLNEGCGLASGKYIARMDADDISLPNRFEEQVNFLESNLEIGVCGSWCEVFDNVHKIRQWKLPESDQELRTRLLFSVPFSHPTVMMRKFLFDKHSLTYKDEFKNAEDYMFWLELSKYTKFANIPKVLLRYRCLESSVSRLAEKEKNNDNIKQ
jgi:glycosyltransferase involved in cell wall biosynthesis